MGELIATSRAIWGLDFKDKAWAAMGNSCGFLETSAKTTAQYLRHTVRGDWGSP
jgi:hypothetical protein